MSKQEGLTLMIGKYIFTEEERNFAEVGNLKETKQLYENLSSCENQFECGRRGVLSQLLIYILFVLPLKLYMRFTNDILTNRLRLGYSCCNRSLV